MNRAEKMHKACPKHIMEIIMINVIKISVKSFSIFIVRIKVSLSPSYLPKINLRFLFVNDHQSKLNSIRNNLNDLEFCEVQKHFK